MPSLVERQRAARRPRRDQRDTADRGLDSTSAIRMHEPAGDDVRATQQGETLGRDSRRSDESPAAADGRA